MKQYTTEWAKEYLREHKNIYAILQSSEPFLGREILFKKRKNSKWRPLEINVMLEHPDGWKNSLVTRDDI